MPGTLVPGSHPHLTPPGTSSRHHLRPLAFLPQETLLKTDLQALPNSPKPTWEIFPRRSFFSMVYSVANSSASSAASSARRLAAVSRAPAPTASVAWRAAAWRAACCAARWAALADSRGPSASRFFSSACRCFSRALSLNLTVDGEGGVGAGGCNELVVGTHKGNGCTFLGSQRVATIDTTLRPHSTHKMGCSAQMLSTAAMSQDSCHHDPTQSPAHRHPPTNPAHCCPHLWRRARSRPT